MSINQIKQSDVTPELWRLITDDAYDTTYDEHRRNSNFYTRFVYLIDEEFFPEYPQYHGFWETNTFIRDAEYGWESTDIDTLTSVEQIEKVITTKEWVPVQNS